MSGFVMKSIARVVPGVRGSFDHRFGGAPAHGGVKPHSGGQPLHLVYNFDCKDPLVPVRDDGAHCRK